MEVTLAGRAIELNDVQPRNADYPIVVRLDGSVIEVNEVQPRNEW